jgi:hypothetical protein
MHQEITVLLSISLKLKLQDEKPQLETTEAHLELLKLEML